MGMKTVDGLIFRSGRYFFSKPNSIGNSTRFLVTSQVKSNINSRIWSQMIWKCIHSSANMFTRSEFSFWFSVEWKQRWHQSAELGEGSPETKRWCTETASTLVHRNKFHYKRKQTRRIARITIRHMGQNKPEFHSWTEWETNSCTTIRAHSHTPIHTRTHPYTPEWKPVGTSIQRTKGRSRLDWLLIYVSSEHVKS